MLNSAEYINDNINSAQSYRFKVRSVKKTVKITKYYNTVTHGMCAKILRM